MTVKEDMSANKNIKVMVLCLQRIRFVLCKEERKKIKSETLCIKRC